MLSMPSTAVVVEAAAAVVSEVAEAPLEGEEVEDKVKLKILGGLLQDIKTFRLQSRIFVSTIIPTAETLFIAQIHWLVNGPPSLLLQGQNL